MEASGTSVKDIKSLDLGCPKSHNIMVDVGNVIVFFVDGAKLEKHCFLPPLLGSLMDIRHMFLHGGFLVGFYVGF